MQNEFVESALLGAGIGLSIIATRTLMSGASLRAQVLTLLLIGVVLCVVQFVLNIRRIRQRGALSPDQTEMRRSVGRKRSSSSDPFARELTRDWTGLDQGTRESDAVLQTGTPEPDVLDPREWLASPAESSHDEPVSQTRLPDLQDRER